MSLRVATVVACVCGLLAATALVAGCGEESVLSSADADTTTEIDVGETFEIELVSNPTTGYSWQVDEIDDAVVTQVGEVEYATEAQKEDIVGAGGVERFSFEGVAAGECTLRLVYVQPWEYESTASVEPETVFSITVVVS